MGLFRKGPFKNRIGLWDFYKGMVIIFVVAGHAWNCWVPPQENSFIHKTSGMMMGSLFFISGYAFKRTQPWECLKKQVKQFLVPYAYMAVLSVLIVLIKNIIMGRNPLPYVISSALGFLLVVSRGAEYFGRELGNCGTGWFLIALFWSWNLLNMFFSMEEEWQRAMAVILLGSLGLLVGGNLQWMFCITQSLRALIFLYVGYLAKRYRYFYSSLPKLLLYLMGLVWGICLLFGATDMAGNIWRLGAFDFLGSIAGALLVLKGYTYLVVPYNWLSETIMKIGRYTYWIMVIHGIDFAGVKAQGAMTRLGLPLWMNLLLHIVWHVFFICVGCISAEMAARIIQSRKNE